MLPTIKLMKLYSLLHSARIKTGIEQSYKTRIALQSNRALKRGSITLQGDTL
jgi:hypothetical protein